MLIYWIWGFVNLLTFIVFGIDKFKAVRKLSRIPEYVLILLSLVGGSVGGFLGMYVWRHKTRKSKFIILIPLILLIHIIIGVWVGLLYI